jgi:predicted phage-related endonuclease
VHPFKASEWGEEGSEDVPIHYAAQVMHGLGVTRRPAAIVAALFGLDNLLCFPVMRDDETIAAMRAKAVKFWTENVLAGVPPEPVERRRRQAHVFEGFKGKPVDLSEAHEALQARTLRSAQARSSRTRPSASGASRQCIAFNWGVMLEPREEPGRLTRCGDEQTTPC